MDSIEKNFGILIAFGLPGFLFLAGLPPEARPFTDQLCTPSSAPTLGGFLYALPVSLGCGLILSGIRWASIDYLMHLTGLSQPKLNYSRLAPQLPAFTILVEHHYRYYQFYSNSLIAVLVLLSVNVRLRGLPSFELSFWIMALCVVLFFASRDCLGRYYSRLTQILPTSTFANEFD